MAGGMQFRILNMNPSEWALVMVLYCVLFCKALSICVGLLTIKRGMGSSGLVKRHAIPGGLPSPPIEMCALILIRLVAQTELAVLVKV